MNNSSATVSASASNQDGLYWAIVYSSRYLVSTCVLIGMIVNPITIVVWSKPVRGVSANARIYYLVLAFAETPNVFTFYPMQYPIGLGFPFTTSFAYTPQNNSYMCQFIWWIWLSSEMIACWSLSALCIERLYAVHKPMLVSVKFTRKRLRIFAVVLFLVSYITNIPAWYVNYAYNGRCGNNFGLGWLGLARFWQAQLFCMAVPVSISVVGNIILVMKIEREAKHRASSLGLKASKSVSKERLASTIVVALSLVHIVFYVPSNAATLTMDMAGALYPAWEGNVATLRFSSLWQSFTSIPHCLNFFVYTTLIPGFRQRVNNMFCCCCSNSNPGDSKTTFEEKDDSSAPAL